MNKRVIIIGVIVLCIVVLVVFLSGFGKQPANSGKEGGSKETGAEMPKKWANLVASNKPYECDVAIKQDDGTTLDMKVYLKGENVREELTVEGAPVVTVARSKNIYTLNEIDIEKRDETLIDCDWLQLPAAGMMSEQFYDIEFFENIGRAVVNCKSGNFGEEKFATAGKVCDLSNLISE